MTVINHSRTFLGDVKRPAKLIGPNAAGPSRKLEKRSERSARDIRELKEHVKHGSKLQ